MRYEAHNDHRFGWQGQHDQRKLLRAVAHCPATRDGFLVGSRTQTVVQEPYERPEEDYEDGRSKYGSKDSARF